MPLDAVGLTPPLLHGAMMAAIGFAISGVPLALPSRSYIAGQALVGCLIAGSIRLEVFPTLLADWPIFLGVTLATILASGLLGYTLGRFRVVPGTVAIWGSSPGAATAMVIIAQAHGADVRMVAVMIYTRVVLVSLAASLLALAYAPAGVVRPSVWIGLLAFDWQQAVVAVIVAVLGTGVGKLLRLPAGALLGPLALGAVIELTTGLSVRPPAALLALAYLAVGWRIGLGFTRDTVADAARALPRLILAALLLIGFCGCLAWLLARTLGLDPVTAYLATSPGGMDTVAIIAAAGSADLGIVMAMQLVRLALVLLIGPAMARYLATRHRTDRAP